MTTPVINNPCPEKWEGMTPDEGGRFCGKCSKLVIDFTKKTTQEIIDFLMARKGEDICGKLKVLPVTAGSSSRQLAIRPRMRIFATALFVVFGSLLFTACGPEEREEPVGKVGIEDTTSHAQEATRDSLARTESIAPKATNTTSTEMDSATIMNTMKVLDSLAALKKK